MKLFGGLLLLILFTSCYSVERNCTDYKTGTFEFTYVIDGIEETGRFTRTENYNIDYYEGKADSSSIRWINDCEFILKKLNPQTNSEKDAIHMKILSTTEDTYTFEYKLAVKRPNKPLRVEKGVAKKVD
ncbi:hypothetical protein DFQ11_102300 [Winogradskyella epiphytica]|uniref:DNA topoisomerase IV n=1 Tax=Winogradskyella epiphytica TaxID=262005 RepID=A0A2V4WWV1_9FLAO|nr:hypothetical protein [Winogradskyella epiphytica]PYE81726.1 hypothetical protein DFQ11_102300 [Winogradskyella epiphytica]GGW63102.1 hypothetical protein GCM10008085_13690 [Winogradskyella epiphytica]